MAINLKFQFLKIVNFDSFFDFNTVIVLNVPQIFKFVLSDELNLVHSLRQVFVRIHVSLD